MTKGWPSELFSISFRAKNLGTLTEKTTKTKTTTTTTAAAEEQQQELDSIKHSQKRTQVGQMM